MEYKFPRFSNCSFCKITCSDVYIHPRTKVTTEPQAVGMDGWQVHVHKESVWDLYRRSAM